MTCADGPSEETSIAAVSQPRERTQSSMMAQLPRPVYSSREHAHVYGRGRGEHVHQPRVGITGQLERKQSHGRITGRDTPRVHEPVALEPDDVIDDFEIIERIGGGGNGVVYLARELPLVRKVAIKLLRVPSGVHMQQLLAEARHTARCKHENIVTLYRVGVYRDSPFLVLEYLEGRTLASLCGTRESYPRVVALMSEVLRALVCAHAAGLVHCDLTPSNVVLLQSGGVKVVDFGIARLRPTVRAGREDRAQAGDERDSSAGTYFYMSPEQALGEDVDHRADLWAFGLLMFELLAGHHPREHFTEPWHWVLSDGAPLPKLHDIAPELPTELCRLVDACLAKRKEERTDDASELLRALEPFLPGSMRWQPPPHDGPYAGLRAFREADAGRFLGRAHDVSVIQERLVDTPLLAVYGPSGIGKTSLLLAGLVPALRVAHNRWLIVSMRPGRAAITALADALAQQHVSSHDALAAAVHHAPGDLGRALRSFCKRRSTRLLLIIDQFEELFTLGTSEADRRAFLDALLGAADDRTSPVRIIVSFRADFMARFADEPRFIAHLEEGAGLFYVKPLGHDTLKDVLVRPAERSGYHYEDTLADEMVASIESTSVCLPLLQFAAARLWENRDVDRRMLTRAAYARMGGVAGALVQHADGVIAAFTPASQALSRSLFLQLVTGERTRVSRTRSELHGLVGGGRALDDLLDRLNDERLVVPLKEDDTRVELVHEALISHWPMLQRWLDENLEQAAFLSRVVSAAAQWHAEKRPAGLLWGVEMALPLRAFLKRHGASLVPYAREFAEAVCLRADQATRHKRNLTIVGVSTLLALLALATSGLIVLQEKEQRAVASAQEAQLRAEEAAQAKLREAVKNDELEAKQTVLDSRTRELLGKQVELEAQNERVEQAKKYAVQAAKRATKDRARAERLLQHEKERAARLKQDYKEFAQELR